LQHADNPTANVNNKAKQILFIISFHGTCVTPLHSDGKREIVVEEAPARRPPPGLPPVCAAGISTFFELNLGLGGQ
jgi:hypothetical protein